MTFPELVAITVQLDSIGSDSEDEGPKKIVYRPNASRKRRLDEMEEDADERPATARVPTLRHVQATKPPEPEVEPFSKDQLDGIITATVNRILESKQQRQVTTAELLAALQPAQQVAEKFRTGPMPPRDGCHICGGPHWKRECPQAKNPDSRRDGRGDRREVRFDPRDNLQRAPPRDGCHICGGNHWKSECPNKNLKPQDLQEDRELRRRLNREAEDQRIIDSQGGHQPRVSGSNATPVRDGIPAMLEATLAPQFMQFMRSLMIKSSPTDGGATSGASHSPAQAGQGN